MNNEHVPILEKAPVTSVVHNGEILSHRNKEKALSITELLQLKNPSPEEIQFTVLSAVFPHVTRKEALFSSFFSQKGTRIYKEKNTEVRRLAITVAASILTRGKDKKTPIAAIAIAPCLGIDMNTAYKWIEEHNQYPHDFNLFGSMVDAQLQRYVRIATALQSEGLTVSVSSLSERLGLTYETVYSFLRRREAEGINIRDILGFSPKKVPYTKEQ